jgi:hypothetical protein
VSSTDPMWANMSHQLGSPVNHLNLSETDIEKLLNSVSNVKSGLLFMTAKRNYDKKNPVTCIPEPSKCLLSIYLFHPIDLHGVRLNANQNI